MAEKVNLNKVLIEGMRKMDGVKRWEIASSKRKAAMEFMEIGRKYYGTKRAA